MLSSNSIFNYKFWFYKDLLFAVWQHLDLISGYVRRQQGPEIISGVCERTEYAILDLHLTELALRFKGF